MFGDVGGFRWYKTTQEKLGERQHGRFEGIECVVEVEVVMELTGS